jgi:hypothetical protein
MLNKPYIHYIDVKIMNNVSRITTGLTSFIRQQDNHWTVLIMIANERLLFTIGVLNS